MSDNRLDDPTIVNASPPFEPPLLPVADPCPRCGGSGSEPCQVRPAGQCEMGHGCPVCGGTGHAPALEVAELCPRCGGDGNEEDGVCSPPCRACNGTGHAPPLPIADPCPICGGNGTFAGVRCHPCDGTGHARATACDECRENGFTWSEGQWLRCYCAAGIPKPQTSTPVTLAVPRTTTEDYASKQGLARNTAADGLAAAARKVLSLDGGDLYEDRNALRTALRRYEEAS